jgi:hypothetical protein
MRTACKEQAEKIFSGSEKRDYVEQCMSDQR